jgi:hypothetical protein
MDVAFCRDDTPAIAAQRSRIERVVSDLAAD